MNRLSFLFILTIIAGTTTAQNREVRDVAQFKRLSFGIPGTLYLTQGSPQKVEIEGPQEMLEEIQTKVEGGRLTIKRDGRWDSRINGKSREIIVYVTVPDIEAVSVSGAGSLSGKSKIRSGNLSLDVSGSGSMSLDIDAQDVRSNVSGAGNLELDGHFKSVSSVVSGSGSVRLSGTIDGPATFDISGSGKIEAKGNSDRVKATISGSGDVLASNLKTKRCDVRISGSGSVEIEVAEELEANISGSGTVLYRGDPKRINSHSSGSGKVRKV